LLRNFLCCVDGSRHSESGVRHAAHLAARCGGRIELLHVVAAAASAEDDELLTGEPALNVEQPPEAPEELAPPDAGIERPERMLSRMVDICRAANVGWTVSTLAGEPATRILERARVADIVTVGRHGEGRDGPGTGVGSVARRVMARTERPLLVATHTFIEPARLLVAYAQSRKGRAALRVAAEVATYLDAGLLVVSVGMDKLKARRALTGAEEYLRAYRLDTEFLYRRGTLGNVAPVLCAERECQMIVVGGFDSWSFWGRLVGDVSGGVLTATRYPVLLCP